VGTSINLKSKGGNDGFGRLERDDFTLNRKEVSVTLSLSKGCFFRLCVAAEKAGRHPFDRLRDTVAECCNQMSSRSNGGSKVSTLPLHPNSAGPRKTANTVFKAV
jgi:hypothetical protein